MFLLPTTDYVGSPPVGGTWKDAVEGNRTAAREANAGPGKQAGRRECAPQGRVSPLRTRQRQSRGLRTKRYAGASGAWGCEECVAGADGVVYRDARDLALDFLLELALLLRIIALVLLLHPPGWGQVRGKSQEDGPWLGGTPRKGVAAPGGLEHGLGSGGGGRTGWLQTRRTPGGTGGSS